MLRKEPGEVLNGRGSALGDALVVTVVGLVRTGHWRVVVSSSFLINNNMMAFANSCEMYGNGDLDDKERIWDDYKRVTRKGAREATGL